MNTEIKQQIKIGDKVTFDNDKVEVFEAETNLENKEIQQNRKLILAGIDAGWNCKRTRNYYDNCFIS